MDDRALKIPSFNTTFVTLQLSFINSHLTRTMSSNSFIGCKQPTDHAERIPDKIYKVATLP